jgi:tol-pal system protein YbgF
MLGVSPLCKRLSKRRPKSKRAKELREVFLHSALAAPYDHFMKTRDTIVACGFGALAAMFVGCATPLQKARSENQLLSKSVEELRADRREQDRKLRDLQRQMQMLQADQQASTTGKKNDRPTGMMSANTTMPELAVTVISPLSSEDAPAGDSDFANEMERTHDQKSASGRVMGVMEDGTEIVYADEAFTAATPPPIIVDRMPGRVNPVRRVRSVEKPTTNEDVEVRTPARTAARVHAPLRPLRAPDRNADAAGKYREAVALLRRGSHSESISMLREFIADNPNHDYADNAQYWLGEAFYDQKDYTTAAAEFQSAISRFPSGNKVPDSMLKLGYCHFANGDAEKGTAVLEQLIRMYPKSEPATLAMKRLESK